MNFLYKWSFKYSYEFFILMINQLLIWINKSYKWSFKCSNEFLGVTSSSRSDNVTLHVCPFVCKSPYFLGTMAPLHFAPLPICSFTPLVVGGCNTYILQHVDQLDSPVFYIWSLGQFTYSKIDLSVCMLSQLPSPTKALFI